jgi:thiol-disulfide isomerase/thioredoxin
VSTHAEPTTLAETDMETLRPAADFDAAAHEETVAALSAPGLEFRIWTADWCPDCRQQTPAFAAALAAADVDPETVTVYPVERGDDGKVGPGMAAFDVELIPTVIVERGGSEVARFEESGPFSVAETLAREL